MESSSAAARFPCVCICYTPQLLYCLRKCGVPFPGLEFSVMILWSTVENYAGTIADASVFFGKCNGNVAAPLYLI